MSDRVVRVFWRVPRKIAPEGGQAFRLETALIDNLRVNVDWITIVLQECACTLDVDTVKAMTVAAPLRPKT